MAKISDPDEWTISYDTGTKEIVLAGGWKDPAERAREVNKYPRRKLK